MICKECGREILETDKFCGICGTPNSLFESAEPDNEHAAYTSIGVDPDQEHPPYTKLNTEPSHEYSPYTQTDTEPVQEYEPYAREPDKAETASVTVVETAEENENVKRTCSLSVVVFCMVVIFLLSVACGVFAGLYINARSAAVAAPYSITQQESGGES